MDLFCKGQQLPILSLEKIMLYLNKGPQYLKALSVIDRKYWIAKNNVLIRQAKSVKHFQTLLWEALQMNVPDRQPGSSRLVGVCGQYLAVVTIEESIPKLEESDPKLDEARTTAHNGQAPSRKRKHESETEAEHRERKKTPEHDQVSPEKRRKLDADDDVEQAWREAQPHFKRTAAPSRKRAHDDEDNSEAKRRKTEGGIEE